MEGAAHPLAQEMGTGTATVPLLEATVDHTNDKFVVPFRQPAIVKLASDDTLRRDDDNRTKSPVEKRGYEMIGVEWRGDVRYRNEETAGDGSKRTLNGHVRADNNGRSLRHQVT